MKFASQLENGTFLRRYLRFFADIQWRDQTIKAHVANTGSLKGCNIPQRPCLFSVSDDPKRKLKYSLEMIQVPGGAWVGVNTSIPNKIVKEALEEGRLPHWRGIESIKPEAKISAETRFDFAVQFAGRKTRHYIEVKNVTLAEDRRAMFPDAVTTRGQKHLRELMRLVEEGHTAELVFTIQRDDVDVFSPADDIDPEYGSLLRHAIEAGVRVTPLLVELSPTEVRLTDRLIPLEI
ncbi:MAG: DNA/RNA nuclease SfsA [Bdellovibrionaceae bacterium]|nr:DNA/RNA nuclease SfsA [Pseudobdellovibrionaceae bacterium]